MLIRLISLRIRLRCGEYRGKMGPVEPQEARWGGFTGPSEKGLSEQLLEVGWHRCPQFEVLFQARMPEADGFRVQEIAQRPAFPSWPFTRGITAVSFIPDDRVAEGRKVNPDLVLPSRAGYAAKQGAVFVGLEDSDEGAGFPEHPVLESRLQAAPLADGDVDFTAVRGKVSIGERQVGF